MFVAEPEAPPALDDGVDPLDAFMSSLYGEAAIDKPIALEPVPTAVAVGAVVDAPLVPQSTGSNTKRYFVRAEFIDILLFYRFTFLSS